ncbi:outer membrane beta-barrel protein [Mangrovibacterium marinum]|uniref:Outer membrane protein with beta-barrel domain n=1 Tax=Mangrovibacterium marinum TaxID=1639118 RepID=A0A2T5C2T7_9BACT|nr:outer membrane beta-barrel protein [Mangrovibacterium marinum]PTN09036.1 outer membrane protein with beta-barrel domain [Mangrovibacterium marinum]
MKKVKINRYKQLVIAALLLLSARAATAQEYRLPEGELSVYLKGPYANLNVDMNGAGDNNSRFGAGLGVQYSRYLNPTWSVSAALEYQSYRAKTVLEGIADAYSLTDLEGDNMVFRTSASTYREWQSAGMLNVPLRIQWENNAPGAHLFAAAGLQLGFPVRARYKATAYGLETSGYFPQWDAELTSPRFMGFGSWGTQQSNKQKLKLKTSYSMLLELGFKQQLRSMRNLYVSAYLELGLNDIAKTNNNQQPLINYDPAKPTQFGYASLLNSSQQTTGTRYTGKVKTQGFGVKMRYAFSW